MPDGQSIAWLHIPNLRRWVEQEKGYVVDGHGDQCKHLQRTAAETPQQDKIVLHLLNNFLVLHDDSRSHNRHRLGDDCGSGNRFQ